MRVGRGPDPIGHQREKATGIIEARSGMQADGRKGGRMVTDTAGRVRLVKRLGEKQLDEMTGEVVTRNAVGWVSLAVWVGEKELSGRMAEVLMMKGALRVSF